MGQPIAHIKSETSGHGPCSPPSTLVESGGNTNVYISTGSACILVVTKGGKAATHGCKDDPPHMDIVTGGSKRVLINKKGVARQGDELNRGSTITSGNKKILVG
tara:strand:+ start:24 stop:335 length:312 start_codon:yes stop_codon:yes gene_type:complete